MMNLLYGIFINLTILFLPVISVFDKKIKRFLKNRKYIFKNISNQINSNNNHIWIHAASLGEYELACLLYTSPSPRDGLLSRMPSSA